MKDTVECKICGKVNGAVDYCNSNEMIFCYVNCFQEFLKLKSQDLTRLLYSAQLKLGELLGTP